MDFDKVLMIGLVVFALLVVLFGGEVGVFVEDEENGFEPDENRTEEVDVEPFYVGREQESRYSYFQLSDDVFSVSFGDALRELGTLPESRVSRGLFSSDVKEIEFNLTQSELDILKELDLDFNIKDTNRFGSLNVYFNDETVFSEFGRAGNDYNIDLNVSNVDESNILKFEASSPGINFWSPTIYLLDDVSVTGSFLERERETFNFELDDEQSTDFREGRIVLYPRDYSGEEPLVVQVNGQDVYRGIPDFRRSSFSIDFDDVEMREGINRVEIFTHQNTEYSFEAADLVYFWGSRDSEPYYKTVEVGESQHRDLPGEIRFTVDRVIEEPDTFYLVIVDPYGEENVLHIDKPIRDGTQISLDITEEEVGIGANEIQFIVEGEGGYHIKEFEVDI